MNLWDPKELDTAIDVLANAKRENRLIALMGNGGSASTAAHAALDWSKAGGARTVDLCGPAHVTAWSNDAAYIHAFSGQMNRLLRYGDVLVAISASGRSPNIVHAAQEGNRSGLRVVALTGGAEEGLPVNALIHASDARVIVASDDIQIIENVHLVLVHLITNALQAAR